MVTYILFVVGFVLLVKGADLLVDGSSALARRFGISDLVIGLTIVAFGTSAPELFVNLIAAFNGTTDLALGNIVGSNIANIFLILGVAAIIYPLRVTRSTVWKEVPLGLLAVVLLAVMANDTVIDFLNFNEVTRSDGIVLISFFVIFLYYTFGIAKTSGQGSETYSKETLSSGRSTWYIVGGLLGLAVGAHWIVGGAVAIAQTFGLSEALIGLSIVAIGTSLPELATSVVAALKKNTDIAVGSAVGSNIFNIFWILGVTAIIQPISLPQGLNFDLAIAAIGNILLLLWMFIGKKNHIDRFGGAVFVIIYALYIIFVVARG